jgi:organic radical activating enzyme
MSELNTPNTIKNPEVTLTLDELSYPVMEHFYTLQGEGAHHGRAAYFIRLAGCDVGCPWCDVKESWDRSAHPDIALSSLVQAVKKSGAPIAVITGGEPLLHDLEALSSALQAIGVATHIETSGSSPFSGQFDWVTLSPKRYKQPLEDIYPKVSELKVVILNKQDFRWAEKHALMCPKHTQLYLQPEWDTPEAVPLIIDYVKQHPQWRVSLQSHKFMHIP